MLFNVLLVLLALYVLPIFVFIFFYTLPWFWRLVDAVISQFRAEQHAKSPVYVDGEAPWESPDELRKKK